MRVEILANRMLRDDRVVPVLAPVARTTGELLRVRDATGHIIRTVSQSERRSTTVDLLVAETELLGRHPPAEHWRRTHPTRDRRPSPRRRPTLDSDQQTMVRTLASSGAGVDVVVVKAGTGKSTALGAYRAALDAAEVPVVGVAPSATAAHKLAMSAVPQEGVELRLGELGRSITDTHRRPAPGRAPAHRRRLPGGVVVILDEAAMCHTRTRLALQRAVDAVNGKVVDVGDHRQIPSVDVGSRWVSSARRAAW